MLGLNRNIWLLVLTQPFALAISPAIVLISGFVGKQLSPTPSLATLPLSMLVIGLSLGAVPAAILMQKYGRKAIFISAMFLGMFASLLAAWGIQIANFVVFLAGVTLVGSTLAVVQQFRFAAIEHTTDPRFAGRAISVLMLGSVAAAFIGTELAALGQSLFQTEYVGSFITITAAYAIAIIILLFFKNSEPVAESSVEKAPFHWRDILKRHTMLIAIASAAIGYGVMSFVMTATPLAMHEMMGHSLSSTKWVIQSHIMAMFLPSLFTGELIRKFGAVKVILTGLLAFLGTTIFGFSGADVFHYWWALVLLGIGWNFLFIGGTTLLTTTYQPQEKYRVQAINDLLIFVFQALSSLSAGVILFLGGWNAIIIIALVPTLFLLSLISYLWRKLK